MNTCAARGAGRKQTVSVHHFQIRVSYGKGPDASAFADAIWIQSMAQSASHLSVSFYKGDAVPRRHPRSQKRRMIDETRMSMSNLRVWMIQSN